MVEVKVEMWFSLLWDVTQCWLVASDRRFWTADWSQYIGNYQCWVTSQKSEDLIYTVVEAWNHTNLDILFNDAVNCNNYVMSVADEQNVSMKHLWYAMDSSRLKWSEKIFFQYHSVHHKPHMD
jgi:hypothetical protein